jgi:hypothetical protein
VINVPMSPSQRGPMKQVYELYHVPSHELSEGGIRKVINVPMSPSQRGPMKQVYELYHVPSHCS